MTVAQSQIDEALAAADAQLDAGLERLFALMRIPSISTDPAHHPDCVRAAEYLRDDLAGLGFETEIVAADSVPNSVPSVIARDADRPEFSRRALFYGHYDVQPVDPLELWRHPPFEPQILTSETGEKVIHGRGASDDKGQVMTFIEAVRAWKSVGGGAPLGVTLLLEGEEEAGGESLGPIMDARRELLTADLALVCDTGMWGARPAITASLRGLVGGAITIRAASRDLHSGGYGAAARNPIHVLAQILADLRDAQGAVALPGFYDGVAETPPEIRAAWDALGVDDAAFLGPVGLSEPAGETGRSALEQIWARPTAEVNGISGGYAGPGFKTVIPAEAQAKVSFRLVGDQNPEAVWSAFQAHVRARTPADCVVEFETAPGAPAVSSPYDSVDIRRASAALEAEWGAPTAVIGGGGSIPAVGEMKERLGLSALMIGFAHDSDQIHSPNEKYDLESFRKGVRSWVRVLAALA
ncbi:MAG: M20/M25/M40 family metallo-hydrolase [Neomegalonema sp.]|nr:M20/M25/M40 family metallo-hydrolase [Neomegalonema sp.]